MQAEVVLSKYHYYQIRMEGWNGSCTLGQRPRRDTGRKHQESDPLFNASMPCSLPILPVLLAYYIALPSAVAPETTSEKWHQNGASQTTHRHEVKSRLTHHEGD